MTKKLIYIIFTVTGAGVIAKGICKAFKNYKNKIYKEGFENGMKAGHLEAKLDMAITKVEKLVDDVYKQSNTKKKKTIFSKKEST